MLLVSNLFEDLFSEILFLSSEEMFLRIFLLRFIFLGELFLEIISSAKGSPLERETSISACSPPKPKIPDRPGFITFISRSSSSTPISRRAAPVAASTSFPVNIFTIIITILCI